MPEEAVSERGTKIATIDATQTDDVKINDSVRAEGSRGLRYWAIISALCVTSSLVALEGTVVSTALPSIVRYFGGGQSYVWVINAYFLACTAFQPMYGQTANIFGRKWLIISAVALFLAGSGISGGATSMSMLIAGRAIQGIGGGGCSMLLDLIICDLVPLRERGTVMSYIFGAATVCTALGPFIGGIIVQRTTWRWVFYINLPISGVSFILLCFCLKMNSRQQLSPLEKLRQVDYTGNAIFITATTAILLALTNAGTAFSWSSWHIIVPLVIGITGLGLFCAYEWIRVPPEPTLPKRLFANRTSAAAFFLTFLHSMFMYWQIYFMPVYFQAVLGSSPPRSGVQLLPTVINLMVFAGVGGGFMEKTGKYLPTHAVSFALMAVGFGVFTLLDANSSVAEWVIYQTVFAAGAGLAIGTLLPAAQAELPETDTATATGTWAVLRSFGTVWGIAVSTAIFNNRFSSVSNTISDPAVRAVLANGHAYEHATKDFLQTLKHNPVLLNQVVSVYTQSLVTTWQVAIALSGLGFAIVFVQRQVNLRTTLNTEFGIVEQASQPRAGKV